MKISKRLVSLLFVAMMIFGLTACGGTSTQSGGNGDATKNEGMKDVINSIPKELKGTTIKYFMWYDGEKETEGPIINAFELESGINVEVEVGSHDDFTTQLAAKVATGKSPDVVRVSTPGITFLKHFQPLENTGYDFSGEEWDQRTMEAYTVNGKAYGVNLKKSIYFDANVLWYNFQTISDLGAEDPYTLWKKNEWTWDNLWSICGDFVKQGGSYGASFNPANALSLSYGVDFLDWDNGKYVNSIADSTRNTKLVKAWTELIDKADKNLITTATWRMDDFNAGRSAFFSTSISSGFVKRSYFEQFKQNGELRCVPFPESYSGDNAIVMSEYPAWCVPKGAKNKEAVPYFLRYMLDESNYDLDEVFADPTIADVFKVLRDSSAPRYSSVLKYTLIEADSGLNYYQMYDKLFSGEVSQITSTLQSFKGGVQDAVDKANGQLANMK